MLQTLRRKDKNILQTKSTWNIRRSLINVWKQSTSPSSNPSFNKTKAALQNPFIWKSRSSPTVEPIQERSSGGGTPVTSTLLSFLSRGQSTCANLNREWQAAFGRTTPHASQGSAWGPRWGPSTGGCVFLKKEDFDPESSPDKPYLKLKCSITARFELSNLFTRLRAGLSVALSTR